MRRFFSQLFSSASAFTFADLIELADAHEAMNPGDRLEKIYDWYFERATTTIRLGVGLAAGSFGSLLGAALKHQRGLPIYMLLLAGLVGVLIAVVSLRLLAQLHREFAVSVRLLGVLRSLKS